MSGRLGPGTKLVERTLAEAFGVSRTVIRQATIFHAGDGLVSIEQNRGAFVSAYTFQQALSVCEALIMVEQAVAFHLPSDLEPSGWIALKRLPPSSRRQRFRLSANVRPCSISTSIRWLPS